MAITKLPGSMGYLDWSDWLRGVFSATISGGSGAVSAGFGTMIVDPKDFNFSGGKIYAVMGATFAFSAAIALFRYLQNKPIPEFVQTETTVKRVEVEPTESRPVPPPPVITTTTKETKVEPISADKKDG